MGDGNDEVFSTDSTGNIHVASLTIKLGDGNNILSLDAFNGVNDNNGPPEIHEPGPLAQFTVDGALTITSGKGNDLIRLNSYFEVEPTREEFDAFFNSENSEDLNRLNITVGSLSITTAAQNDIVGLFGVGVSGNASISTGITTSAADDDTVVIVDLEVGGNLSVKTGGSQDLVAADSLYVDGSTTVDTGDGFDKVLIDDSGFGGAVTVLLGKGDDLLLIGEDVDVFDPKKVTIDGGPGHDVASRIVNELRAAGAKVTGGIVNVSDSFDATPVLDRLYAAVVKLLPDGDVG